MRRLPNKSNLKQKLIIEATKDFFGKGYPIDGSKRKFINVALWIMGKRKKIQLNDEEWSAIWHIKQNLRDETYCSALNFKLNRDFSKEDKIYMP